MMNSVETIFLKLFSLLSC